MDVSNMRGRLLLVEDEPTDALLLRKALMSHLIDAQIELASCGDEAMKFLMVGESEADPEDGCLPQLILTDLNLPGINGFELLRKIKSTRSLKGIPVVVLTSSNDSRDIRRAFAEGANSYLVKPNTFAESLALTRDIVHYWLSLDQKSAGRFSLVDNAQHAA